MTSLSSDNRVFATIEHTLQLLYHAIYSFCHLQTSSSQLRQCAKYTRKKETPKDLGERRQQGIINTKMNNQLIINRCC